MKTKTVLIISFTYFNFRQTANNWLKKWLHVASKKFTSEEIIDLIMWEENETKRVPRSREGKQMELHQSQNMNKKSKVKSFYDKGISKFASLQHCTKNHIFFFQMFWKDGLSKKNRSGIWSFLYHQERWYFFSPKIWYYSLGGKWKMIFLKKIHGNMIYSSNVLKRWSFQKNCTGIWSFLYYQERWYFFFPKIWSYSLDEKWKTIFLKKSTWLIID